MLNELINKQNIHNEMPRDLIEKNLNGATEVLKIFSRNDEGKIRSNELYVKKQFINSIIEKVIDAYKTYLPQLSKYFDINKLNINLDFNQEKFNCVANRKQNTICADIPANISAAKNIEEASNIKSNITNVQDSASLGIQIENMMHHELGHFIWSNEKLFQGNKNFNSLVNEKIQGVPEDDRDKALNEFTKQDITNSAFDDFGEGFAISMELILLEELIKKEKITNKDEYSKYFEARKNNFKSKNISTSPDDNSFTQLDSISVIYKIYKEFGEQGVDEFIKHCDAKRLIDIKKYEKGYFITKDAEKNFDEQIEEYEKMIGRNLTEKEKSTFDYERIIGNKLTEEYKSFLKMSGKEIMANFLAFEA